MTVGASNSGPEKPIQTGSTEDHLWHVSPRSQSRVRGRLGRSLALRARIRSSHRPRLGGADLDEFFQDWVYCGLSVAAGAICLCAGSRCARSGWPGSSWASGSLSWTAADIIWTLSTRTTRTRPTRGVAMCSAWPAIRPATSRCCCVARSRVTRFRSSLWLDGRSRRLTVAALIATLVYQPILDATAAPATEPAVEPRLSRRRPAAARPGGGRLRPARAGGPDPAWLVLGGGLALSAVGGRHLPGPDRRRTPTWRARCSTPSGRRPSLLVGAGRLAAGQARALRVHDCWSWSVPVVCGVVAVGLLSYDHFVQLNGLTVASPRDAAAGAGAHGARVRARTSGCSPGAARRRSRTRSPG